MVITLSNNVNECDENFQIPTAKTDEPCKNPVIHDVSGDRLLELYKPLRIHHVVCYSDFPTETCA